MKKFLAFFVFLTLASAQLSHAQRSASQFSVPSPERIAATQAAQSASRAALPQGSTGKTRTAFSHPYTAPSNPPVSPVNFLSATQIAAGGETLWSAASADFNNDGKLDFAAPVKTGATTFAISVVLNNGDGTFRSPILVSNPHGTAGDQVLLGDFNGDGNQDLIVVHSGSSSSFDVWLGNGNGGFSQVSGTSTTICPSYLVGGAVTQINGKTALVFVDALSPANVWTVVGNGNGTFAAQTPASVALSGGTLNNLVFADFNGDGILDFAATTTSGVSGTTGPNVIYLGQAGTHITYAAQPTLSNPDGFYDVCNNSVGDLNGDGNFELITANCHSLVGGNNTAQGNLTVYINNGDGTFKQGVYYSAGTESTDSTNANLGPVAVTIADVNGDGKNDVISSNANGGDVTVLLGNGDGTLNVPTLGISSGGTPRTSALVADFNGDGFADIIVPDQVFSFVYLQGYGDGTFRGPMDYYGPVPGSFYGHATSIASGDFNGDGNPDFVVGNQGFDPASPSGLGITVFLSNPDGSLQAGVNLGTGGSYQGVTAGDFTGNGKLSIAAVNQSNNGVQIYTGNGTGSFSASSFYPTGGTSAYSIASADFNNDGFRDLVTLNSPVSGTENISVLMNDGSGHGTFNSAVTYATSAKGSGIAIGDVNGDGIPDIVVSQANQGVDVFLGNGDGTFQPVRTTVLGFNSLGSIALGDLNADGKLDLAVAVDDGVTPQEGIAVAQGNGDGTFSNPIFFAMTLQTISLIQPKPAAVQIANLNGNGKMDVVYGNQNYGTVGVLYNTGTNPFASGMFYDPVEYAAGSDAYALALVDVNRDGALDVVVANDSYAGVTVLLNGSGALATVLSSTNPAPVTKPVTLTANIAANVKGITAVPTGSATFYDGSTSLGTANLTSGVATFNASALAVGSHNITAQYFGDSNFLASTSAVVSQVVTLIPNTNTLTTSVSPVGAGQSVTLKATIASSASGVTAVPTGSVTFYDGTAQLGSVAVSNSAASFATSSLAAGTHSITAHYTGDANFAATISSALIQAVVSPDFALGATPAVMSVNPGSSATYTINVSPSYGYSGTVSFACPASLPAQVGCSFDPTSSAPSNNVYPSTTLTLTTVGPSAAFTAPVRPNSKPGVPMLWASLSGFGLVGIVFAGFGRKRTLNRMMILGVLSLGIMFTLVACGGSTSSTHTGGTGTPAGQYTVGITATGNGAGAPSHTMNVVLTVQ